jgi:hypothetical protein
MSDHKVGYKNPPLHTRFGPGNRYGCFKRKRLSDAETLERVFNTPTKYRQGEKLKCAPRIEVLIRRFGSAALKGDVDAARKLFKMRLHVQRYGDINQKIIIQELTEEDGKLC